MNRSLLVQIVYKYLSTRTLIVNCFNINILRSSCQRSYKFVTIDF